MNPSTGIPTPVRMLRMMYDFTLSRALYAACELGIADALGSAGRTAGQLAADLNLPEDSLVRLMRPLVAAGVFGLDETGRYRGTELAGYLRADHPESVRDEFRQQTEFAAWVDFLPALRTGTSAYQLRDRPGYYAQLDADPDSGRSFRSACRSRSRAVFGPLLAGYPWQPGETVVDLGGGLGHGLLAVLEAAPTVRGILYDQPAAIEQARAEPWPPTSADRVRFVTGDFGAEPLPAADTYLLGNIVHNAATPDAVRLLRRIRRDVPHCRRLVLAEQVLPDGTARHPAQATDLWMLVLLGGRERTADEYRSLVAAAGWQLADIRHDPVRLGDLLTCVPAEEAPDGRR